MKRWTIWCLSPAKEFLLQGTYAGDTEDAAFEAYAQAEGFPSFAALNTARGLQRGLYQIREVQ